MRWKEGKGSILSNAVRQGTCPGWLLPMIFCGLALVIGCGRETSAPEALSPREAPSPREAKPEPEVPVRPAGGGPSCGCPG